MEPRFPPRTEGMAELRHEAEAMLRQGMKGLNIDDVLEAHTKKCEDFVKYVNEEHKAKEAIYQEAQDKWTEAKKLRAQLKQLWDAKPEDPAGSGSYKDAAQVLQTRVERVDAELMALANRLQIRRAEAEGYITGALDYNKDGIGPSQKEIKDHLKSLPPPKEMPFNLKPPQYQGDVDPRAPSPSTLRGPEYASMPSRQPNMILGRTPDLEARREEMYQQGKAGNPAYHRSDSFDDDLKYPSGLIPDWFRDLDKSGRVKLHSETLEDRYKELMNKMHRLQTQADDEKKKGKTKQWDKNWHEPNPGWPHPHQQQHGGWFKCRYGPEATRAEIECRVCHRAGSQAGGGEVRSAEEQYDDIMEQINISSKRVMAADKKEIIGRIRGQRLDREKNGPNVQEAMKENRAWRTPSAAAAAAAAQRGFEPAGPSGSQRAPQPTEQDYDIENLTDAEREQLKTTAMKNRDWRLYAAMNSPAGKKNP